MKISLIKPYPTNAKKHSAKQIKQVAASIEAFGGGGSTLIAAEKSGRIGYVCEFDPKYVDVIVQRYVDYTKGGEVKLNGKTIQWPQKT